MSSVVNREVDWERLSSKPHSYMGFVLSPSRGIIYESICYTERELSAFKYAQWIWTCWPSSGSQVRVQDLGLMAESGIGLRRRPMGQQPWCGAALSSWFAGYGCSAVGSRVVLDGNLVTSRGPGTAFEFALSLVKVLYGEETATQVAEPMVMYDHELV